MEFRNDSTTAGHWANVNLMRWVPKFVDKTIDRIGYWYGAWLLAGVPIMGILTAWASSYSQWVTHFGAVGWIFSGLVASILLSALVLLGVLIRSSWIRGSALRKWATDVNDINPMDRDFRKKRMEFNSIAHPFSNSIEDKRFYDCDLIGPANIFLHQDLELHNVEYIGCDIVVLASDSSGRVSPGNSIALRRVELHGCKVFGATIMIPRQLVHTFHQMGAKFKTLTGVNEIDNLLHQSGPRENQE